MAGRAPDAPSRLDENLLLLIEAKLANLVDQKRGEVPYLRVQRRRRRRALQSGCCEPAVNRDLQGVKSRWGHHHRPPGMQIGSERDGCP